MSHAKPGDPIRLGICIGFGNEPGKRWGRLVGIRHQPDSIHTYIVREFQPGDGRYPTGGYRTTSSIFLIPHLTDRPCPSAV